MQMCVGTEPFVRLARTGMTVCGGGKHLSLLSADKIVCCALDFTVTFRWSGKSLSSILKNGEDGFLGR